MSSGLSRVLLVVVLVAAIGLIGFKSYDMFSGKNESILQGIDDTFYFLWLRSAVIDGDLDFTDDVEQTTTVSAAHRDDILSGDRTETGRIPNKYWIGWALVNAVPFGLVALFALIGGIEVTGFEPAFLIAIWIFQLALGFYSLVFATRLIRRYTTRESAILGVLLVWLTSPLIYYQTARLSLVHNQVFFLVTALYLLSFRIKDQKAGWATWFLTGLTGGLAVITRSTAIVYLIFPAIVVLEVIQGSEWQRWLPRSALALAGAAIPVILQVVAWRAVYGQFIVFSYQGESFNFASPSILAVLFSDYHGFFNWHPFLLIGLVAFVASVLRTRDIRWTWVVSTLLIIYVNASWWNYWFGSSFGNRSFEVLCLFAMMGTALLLDGRRSSWMRKGVLVLGIVALVWNLQLVIGWLVHTYPREVPVTYTERILDFDNWQATDQDSPGPLR